MRSEKRRKSEHRGVRTDEKTERGETRVDKRKEEEKVEVEGGE